MWLAGLPNFQTWYLTKINSIFWSKSIPHTSYILVIMFIAKTCSLYPVLRNYEMDIAPSSSVTKFHYCFMQVAICSTNKAWFSTWYKQLNEPSKTQIIKYATNLQTDIQDRAGNQCSFSELVHTEVLFEFFYPAALPEEFLQLLMAFNDKCIQTCKMFWLLTKLMKHGKKAISNNKHMQSYLPHSMMKSYYFYLHSKIWCEVNIILTNEYKLFNNF